MTSGRRKEPANTNRPAGFDQRVIAHMPKLRRFARRFGTDRIDDLVQSTVEQALRYWKSYDPNKDLGGWLRYQMRSVAFLDRKTAPIGSDKPLEFLSVDPEQTDVVSIKEVLRAVDASPHAEVMHRLAIGDTLNEVAERFGVSKQRVHQKVVAFRRAARRAA